MLRRRHYVFELFVPFPSSVRAVPNIYFSDVRNAPAETSHDGMGFNSLVVIGFLALLLTVALASPAVRHWGTCPPWSLHTCNFYLHISKTILFSYRRCWCVRRKSYILKPGTHWRKSWIQYGGLCWKSTVLLWPRTVHTGNKVVRIGNKVERIRQQSTSFPICCRGFGNSRLSTKSTVLNNQLCRQCVPGFTFTTFPV